MVAAAGRSTSPGSSTRTKPTTRTTGDGDSLTEEILSVDDPEWAEATFADVLAALTAPEDGGEPSECGWDVVFLADAASMTGPEPTLLAVSTDPEEPTEPYRVPALGTPHALHGNLALATMDFEEFAGEPPH
ncbi:DUF6924 domain-containing protein [Streptomyces sp. NPDC002514]